MEIFKGAPDHVARFRAFAPRERLLVKAAGLTALLVLLWVFGVQPAWRTLRDAPAKIERLDEQLESMRLLAAESRSLREIGKLSLAQAAAAIKSASDALGDRAKLVLQGDRATLTVTDVDFAKLLVWLGEARSAGRARLIEAQLRRGEQGYSGSLVLDLEATR